MGAPTRGEMEAYQSHRPIREADIVAEAYDCGVETDLPWSAVRIQIGHSYALTDDRGRSESSGSARLMQRCRREFWKGRRDGARRKRLLESFLSRPVTGSRGNIR